MLLKILLLINLSFIGSQAFAQSTEHNKQTTNILAFIDQKIDYIVWQCNKLIYQLQKERHN